MKTRQHVTGCVVWVLCSSFGRRENPKLTVRSPAMQKKGAMVRETGSIIVSDRSETRHKVHDAFVKAEKEQWHTQEEKECGKYHWTGSGEGAASSGELEETENTDKWSAYCQRHQPKRARGSEEIVPTCPPHPIGANAEKEMKRKVDEWIKKVLREDDMRRRGA